MEQWIYTWKVIILLCLFPIVSGLKDQIIASQVNYMVKLANPHIENI